MVFHTYSVHPIFSASRYDIRHAGNRNKILTEFHSATLITQNDITEGSLNSPKTSGESELFRIQLPKVTQNTTFYLAVVAVDEDGMMGDVSNLGVIFSTESQPEVSRKTHDDSAIVLGVIFGISAFVLIMILAALAVLYCKKHRPKTAVGCSTVHVKTFDNTAFDDCDFIPNGPPPAYYVIY